MIGDRRVTLLFLILRGRAPFSLAGPVVRESIPEMTETDREARAARADGAFGRAWVGQVAF